MGRRRSSRAFTIVEVVIVLAIAGLIFAVVFAGIPTLMSSRRDNQRIQDMQNLMTAMIRYQENTGNSVNGSRGNAVFPVTGNPSTTDAFSDYVLNEDDSPVYVAPGNERYIHRTISHTSQDFVTNSIRILSGYRCNDTSDGWINTAPVTDMLVIVKLEKGKYCVDNTDA